MAKVVLTRPEGKNQALAEALTAQGIHSLELPALSVLPTLTTLPLSYQPQYFDLLVFVSAQAASFYLAALTASGLSLPAGLRIATVGAASAQPFYDVGLAQQVQLIHPAADHPYQDSEALWALLTPELPSFSKVLVVRGQQGREWLSQQFTDAGKLLTRCSIYERQPAIWGVHAARQLTHTFDDSVAPIILLSSSESTQAIYNNVVRLGLSQKWSLCHFVAIHPRIVDYLRGLSASSSLTAAQIRLCSPSQESMTDALVSVARSK